MYGGKAAKIAAAAAELGEASPVEESNLWPAAIPYYEAFRRLNAGRRYAVSSMGTFPLGLEYGEVSTYARDYGHRGAEFDLFVRLVYALDETFLEHASSKRS